MLIYQMIMALVSPVLLLLGALRGGLRERLGFLPPPGPGPRLWLHGASNGELTSAHWVLQALLMARPGLQVLVTANSATGRAMVVGWGLPGVVAAFAPLDTMGANARVLDRWEPLALIIVENELWPSRIAAADRRGVPVMVIGARMSERSARRWRMLAGLIRSTMGRITWLSAQDEGSLQRFLSLGLDKDAAGPVVVLKAQGAMEPMVAPPLPFACPAPRERVLLAASTHEGEEEIALAGFLAARVLFDLLIIAPRHPRRGPEIAAMLSAHGVAFATRTRGEVPDPETMIYLADTMGEMAAWYAMAGACLIGGTFAPRGGHTPWEPTRAGCAILHGPDVTNNAPPFAALDQGGGALRLARQDDLGPALRSLTPIRQTELATAAKNILAPKNQAQSIKVAILTAIDGRIIPTRSEWDD